MGRYERQGWAKLQINRNQCTIFSNSTEKAQKIKNTILSFNAIRHLLQNKTDTKTTASILQRAFDNVGKSKMKYFLELIQQSESNYSRASEVKAKGKNITIPAGKNMQVNCKSNMGLVKKERAMIVQSNDVELPKGIQCPDSVVMLTSSIKNCFKTPIINESN